MPFWQTQNSTRKRGLVPELAIGMILVDIDQVLALDADLKLIAGAAGIGNRRIGENAGHVFGIGEEGEHVVRVEFRERGKYRRSY